MDINAGGDLGWRALRYVARRMTPDEICDFELHLACDQSAREAVAQAVELAHTVAVLHGGACAVAVERTSMPQTFSGRQAANAGGARWPTAAFAGAMAASLLIAAFSIFNFGIGRSRAPRAILNAQRVALPRDQLSSAWARFDPARVQKRAAEPGQVEELAEDAAGESKDADSPIPAWMLHGLRGPRWMGDQIPQEM